MVSALWSSTFNLFMLQDLCDLSDAGLQALWDSSLVLLLSDHVGNSVQEDSNPSETLRLLRLYSSLYWHAHTVAEYTVYPYTELILSKTLHTEWAAIAVSAYATLVRRCGMS